MSSVLTNKGAMIALETLRGINKNMATVQSQISTGKKIASSSDNAAIWSIATVMESDVKSFEQITDSLNLGSATIGVAQSASNQITNLLQDAKSLIVAANDASVTAEDRAKYQTDIDELTGTIGSIVNSASFNGQNLLKGSSEITVLSSLNRQADGSVTAGNITVARIDLSTDAAVDAVVAVDAADAIVGGTIASGDEVGATLSGTTVGEDGGAEPTLTITTGTTVSETTYSIDIGTGSEQDFTVDAGLDQDEVAAELQTQITAAIAAAGGNLATDLSVSVTDNVITFDNSAGDNGGARDITLALGDVENASVDAVEAVEAADAIPAGGLFGLTTIDLDTVETAAAALTAIDNLLQTAIDATAEFGSKQKRIDNQNEFITTLTNSLKTGIGAMTDANLEEASARLQSLQVQQQLGTQSLSIANQAPQALLQLFQ